MLSLTEARLTENTRIDLNSFENFKEPETTVISDDDGVSESTSSLVPWSSSRMSMLQPSIKRNFVKK